VALLPSFPLHIPVRVMSKRSHVVIVLELFRSCSRNVAQDMEVLIDSFWKKVSRLTISNNFVPAELAFLKIIL